MKALQNSKEMIMSLIIVVTVLFGYTCKALYEGVYPVSDSRWTIHIAMSLLQEANTDLNEYEELLNKNNHYGIETIQGKEYSFFPIGSAILSLPFVYATKMAFRLLTYHGDGWFISRFEFNDFIRNKIPIALEQFIAAFYVALTAGIIFLISVQFVRRGISFLITFIFAFCTSAWPVASRAMWQHGPSMLMIALTLFIIIKSEKNDNPNIIPLAGLPLAFSYIIRPTNSLSIIIFTGYIFLKYRQKFWQYLLAMSVVLLPFVIYSFSIYGNILPTYYFPQRLLSNNNYIEGLWGNLISPARGLFIYSPVLILMFYGIFIKLRRHAWSLLDTAISLNIVVLWLTVSSFSPWFAGHTYGNRFLSDVLPLMFFLLIPALGAIFDRKNKAFKIVALSLIGISFLMNMAGAVSESTLRWNAEPVDVGKHQDRLWDWSDPPFMRVFGKMGK